MTEINNCPVCNSINWQSLFTVKDHSISAESFQLKKCSTCSIVVTSPRPDNDKLDAYYESDNYISHSGKPTGIVNFIYLQARKVALRWKLKIILNLKQTGSIADIGCGTGEFLHTMQRKGWLVSGVEPNTLARAKADTILGLTIQSAITELSVNQDIITLWHVLEHLPDLNESLSKIHGLLNPSGKLLIAVPNHLSQDAITYKLNWAAYDVPRHLWHFNQKSMALLLQKHGFKIEETIPMKMDSFYVSMLSEKYLAGGKNTITGLMKGFINGLRSNRAAKQSSEYSSLIYIASK